MTWWEGHQVWVPADSCLLPSSELGTCELRELLASNQCLYAAGRHAFRPEARMLSCKGSGGPEDGGSCFSASTTALVATVINGHQ